MFSRKTSPQNLRTHRGNQIFFKKYVKTKWSQIYFRINIVQLKKNIFMEIDSKARGGKANGFQHIILIYRLKKCLLEYIYLNIVCF